jgi:hypothetical protein
VIDKLLPASTICLVVSDDRIILPMDNQIFPSVSIQCCRRLASTSENPVCRLGDVVIMVEVGRGVQSFQRSCLMCCWIGHSYVCLSRGTEISRIGLKQQTLNVDFAVSGRVRLETSVAVEL